MFSYRFDQVVQANLNYHNILVTNQISAYFRSRNEDSMSIIDLDEEKLHKPIELNEMFRNSFIYLLIGLCLSLLVFLFELSTKSPIVINIDFMK